MKKKVLRHQMFTVSGKPLTMRGFKSVGPFKPAMTECPIGTEATQRRLARAEKMLGEKCEWRKV